MFHASYKGVSSVFQRFFKEVQRNFPKCFKKRILHTKCYFLIVPRSLRKNCCGMVVVVKLRLKLINIKGYYFQSVTKIRNKLRGFDTIEINLV